MTARTERTSRPHRPILLGLLVAGLLALIGGMAYFIGLQIVADRHFQRAQEALQRRDFGTALKHLGRGLAIRPDSLEGQFQMARTARRSGHYDEATASLENYKRLGGVPEAVELEQVLARAQRGDFGRFESYLYSCVQRGHPDAGLILEAMAKGYIRTYRIPQAGRCLSRLLELEPDNVQALIWRGELAERRRNYADALAEYRRAVELEPENDEACLKLADVLLHTHKAALAADQYEHVRQHQPGHFGARIGLARCRRELGQVEEAKELLEVLLSEDPGNVRVLHEFGLLALQREHLSEAEDWLRKALALAPQDRELVYTMQQCLEQRGKKEEAKEYRARLERIEADLDRLGDLTRQIAQNPHDPALRCEAGIIFLSSGQEVEGLRWLDSALQEDPGHQATHAALADFYQRSGRVDLAAQHRKLSKSAGTPP